MGTINVKVSADTVELTLGSEDTCEVLVYGKKYALSSKKTVIEIPEEWR